MKGTKILVGAVALAILLGGCATTQTQTSTKDWEELCAALGHDKDKPIGKEKFLSGAKDKKEAERLFAMCDTNRDEYLTLEEYLGQNLGQKPVIDNLIRLTPPPPVRPVR